MGVHAMPPKPDPRLATSRWIVAKPGMYDAFSEDYDRFVDWDARLAFELPFLLRQLENHGAQRVLDAACGTGQHAIALAQHGYDVAAADQSEGMVSRARANAQRAGVDLQVHRLGFEDLEQIGQSFDAVICLGNSLPHAATAASLRQSLAAMAHCLRPAGLLILQQRNLARVLDQADRFLPLEAHSSGGEEWLFLRFYDLDVRPIRFNLVRMHRSSEEGWEMHVSAVRLGTWDESALTQELRRAGLETLSMHGSLTGGLFDRHESGDIVIVAQRQS